MSILSTLLCIYLFSLVFSLFCGLVRFLRDIRKWKDKEEPVHITASQFEDDLSDSADDFEIITESEVSEDVEHREHHTPIIF